MSNDFHLTNGQNGHDSTMSNAAIIAVDSHRQQSSKQKPNVRITTAVCEIEFYINNKVTGYELFDRTVAYLGIRESWYFALQYDDYAKLNSYLKPHRKVLGDKMKKADGDGSMLKLKFRVRLWPEDIAEDIVGDDTRKMFYVQVREAILNEDIYCPPETCVLLASYCAQVKYGDYSTDEHTPAMLANDQLLPKRIMAKFQLTHEEWAKRVILWWSDHRGLTREQAMLEYLKIAQDLEMYGIEYYDIRNKKGTELYLGVDALGLNIYERADRLSPKVGFPWSEMRSISYNNTKFIIKPIDKRGKDFVFYAPQLHINKQILDLCMDYHKWYLRRRSADAADQDVFIAQLRHMKMKAAEENRQRQAHAERLSREILARESAVQRQIEQERRLADMQADMARAREELVSAKHVIDRLEQQLHDVEVAKQQLERKEAELVDLMHHMETERELKQEEREQLMAEMAIRESELVSMREHLSAQNEETIRLQREAEEVRSRQHEVIMHAPPPIVDHHHHQQQPAPFEADHRPASVTHTHRPSSTKSDDYSYDGYEQSPVNNTNRAFNLVTPPIHEEIMHHHQPELDRTTAFSHHEIKKKLDELAMELSKTQNADLISDYDILHMENKRAGRDKYKTLKQIRQGNTRRRVEQFEMM